MSQIGSRAYPKLDGKISGSGHSMTLWAMMVIAKVVAEMAGSLHIMARLEIASKRSRRSFGIGLDTRVGSGAGYLDS